MFFCKDQDQSVTLDAFQERLQQPQQVHADNAETLNAALRLIADIREAAGDPEGKLMQSELVTRIRRMAVTLSALIYQTEDPPTVTLEQVGKLAAEAISPLQ